jgi:glycosyltransferase involved in cell wall biosynthesis
MAFRIDPPISTIWLDVSLLRKDSRKTTGIPRVRGEIFRAWWSAGYINLRLCQLDMDLRAFTEVHPRTMLRCFPLANQVAELQQGKPTATIPGPRFAQRAVSTVRAGYHCLPRSTRWLLRQGYIAGRRTYGWVLKQLAQRTDRPHRVLPNMPLTLSPTDLVVSLGGNWNLVGSGALCRRLRQEMGFRSVHFIHDLIPINQPQFYPSSLAEKVLDWTIETLENVDLIVANSNHTRRDIQAFCSRQGIQTPPIEVVRLGELLPTEAAPEAAVSAPFNPSQPFVLSVGTLEIRKNHLLLYHVWRRLVERNPANVPPLVLVGAQGWLAEEMLHQIRQDPLTRKSIVLVPNCNDQQLRWLYQNCLFTMYPSHSEGWGLPIAESLAMGKYCIASNTTSMPEIGGDLVGMHDPCDLPTCLHLVTEALDPVWRAAREDRIRRSYRRTTWAETGRQLTGHIEKHFGPIFRSERGELARSA